MWWSLYAPAIPRRQHQCAPTGRTVPQTTRLGRQRGVSWCTQHQVTSCAPATTSRILHPLGRASGRVQRMCWGRWMSSARSNLYRTSQCVVLLLLGPRWMYGVLTALRVVQLVTALFLLLVLCASLVCGARSIDAARPPPAYRKDTKVRLYFVAGHSRAARTTDPRWLNPEPRTAKENADAAHACQPHAERCNSCRHQHCRRCRCQRLWGPGRR